MRVEFEGYEMSINDALLLNNCVTDNLYDIIVNRKQIAVLLREESLGVWDGHESLLMEKLTDLEFQLQEAWGFSRDSTKHSYQWKLSKCSCGGLLGNGMAWIDKNCPYHSEYMMK